MDRVGENISGTISYTAKKIPILKLWKLYIPELTRFMTLDSHLHTDETLVALLYCARYGLGRAWIEGLRVDSLYWGTLRVSQVLAAITCLAAAGVQFTQLKFDRTEITLNFIPEEER